MAYECNNQTVQELALKYPPSPPAPTLTKNACQTKALFDHLLHEVADVCSMSYVTPIRAKLTDCIFGFCNMKRLGVFLLRPRWDASPSQGSS